MAYHYNKLKIKEFADKQGKSASDLRRITKVTREGVAEKWLEGSTPSCNTICVLADKLGVDILEFFSKDGRPLTEIYQKREENTNQKCQDDNIQSIISESEHLKQLHELEKTYLREIMEKEVGFARKEIEIKDRIRQELKNEFAADKQKIIDSYEKRLAMSNEQINQLRMQIAELSAQYKELEASQKEKGYSYLGAMGLAEPSVKR